MEDRVNALEKLVADLVVEVTSLREENSAAAAAFGLDDHHRRLQHNASILSIYEFPQMGGSPIYIPSGPASYSTFTKGQRPVLPGSGEKGRPTYYLPALPRATNGYTSLGVVFNSGDTAWMLTSTALVLLMTMPGTKHE